MLTIYDEKGGSFVTSRNSEATHEITSWSPNQTSVFIDTPQETTIALNTNFVEGWHVRGGKLTQVDGRVAARVAPGKHILTFAYKAPGFVVGAAISGVTTLLLLIYGANAWKNRG